MQTCLNEGSVRCTNRSKYKTKMKAKNDARTLIFNININSSLIGRPRVVLCQRVRGLLQLRVYICEIHIWARLPVNLSCLLRDLLQLLPNFGDQLFVLRPHNRRPENNSSRIHHLQNRTNQLWVLETPLQRQTAIGKGGKVVRKLPFTRDNMRTPVKCVDRAEKTERVAFWRPEMCSIPSTAEAQSSHSPFI